MDETIVLGIVKERLGIKTNVRDTYLTHIIRGIQQELTDEKGIVLEAEDASHLMFIVDYAAWRYESRDSDKGMPRHLQFRLHNLFIHARGDT